MNTHGNPRAYRSRDSLSAGAIAAAFALAFACGPSEKTPSTESPETPAPSTETRAAPVVATECYVSDQSILARRPNSPAPGPAQLRGWVELERLGSAESGPGRLVDSDGAALHASWRRGEADSTLVEGFDDFLRVELRLALSDGGATGSAVAMSDAALERGADGVMHDFRRNWRVAARRAPCDSLPKSAQGGLR